MPVIRAGFLTFLVVFALYENWAVLKDVETLTGFESWSDFLVIYGLLAFAAWCVFLLSENFAINSLDVTKRHQKVTHYLNALIFSFAVAFFAYANLEAFSSTPDATVGFRTFLFVAAFSCLGVFVAHRRK
jgi:hypothetical protein